MQDNVALGFLREWYNQNLINIFKIPFHFFYIAENIILFLQIVVLLYCIGFLKTVKTFRKWFYVIDVIKLKTK